MEIILDIFSENYQNIQKMFFKSHRVKTKIILTDGSI